MKGLGVWVVLVKTESVQIILSRILAGKERTKKVETREWCREEGCGFGFLSPERLEYIYRYTCWANPVFPEDAHGLWGEPI